jgi:hypothetical protein
MPNQRKTRFQFRASGSGGFYGRDGNESEDPIVIMKLMLLLFLDNVVSERELMRIVPESLVYLMVFGDGFG